MGESKRDFFKRQNRENNSFNFQLLCNVNEESENRGNHARNFFTGSPNGMMK